MEPEINVGLNLNLNWPNALEFLQKEYRLMIIRQNESELQKEYMEVFYFKLGKDFRARDQVKNTRNNEHESAEQGLYARKLIVSRKVFKIKKDQKMKQQ